MKTFLVSTFVIILMTTLTNIPVFEAETSLATPEQWTDYDRPEEFKMVTDIDVFITMRDGVRLAANVYWPDTPGKCPLILTQTPYNKNSSLGSAND
ncbi:CocE/NonD family hydrolase [Neobacillus terrae]|uniref:CocE/NonD family hydrolase n=1 Tax=Neobacillus terrae TaxID=3034837 RepID=UPI00140AE721|nr:CocE/NonD family hydrolase [Neobacillus terrae]NHM32492.1 hypothetical protein [Neobacillus terrae]